MTLAHVAGGEETAGTRRAREVGDAGAGVVRISRGTAGCLVVGCSDFRKRQVQPVPLTANEEHTLNEFQGRPRPSTACAIPVVMLALSGFRLQAWSSVILTLEEDLARITRGSYGWDWRRVPAGQAAAMFQRGFMPVPDPEFNRSRGNFSAVSSTLQAKSAAFNSSFTSPFQPFIPSGPCDTRTHIAFHIQPAPLVGTWPCPAATTSLGSHISGLPSLCLPSVKCVVQGSSSPQPALFGLLYV
ncbi:hypothetical protein MRX96_024808 [Rhipicephalus microplus]